VTDRALIPSQPARRRLGVVAAIARELPIMLRLALAASVLATAAGSAVQAVGFKVLIDAVGDRSWESALWGLGLAIFGVATLATAGRVYLNLKDWLAPELNLRLHRRTLNDVATIPSVEHLERPDYLDQIGLVRDGGDTLVRTVFAITDNVLVLVQLVVTITLLASVHPLLAGLPAFVVPSVLLVPRAHAHLERAREAAAEALRRSKHLDGLFADVDAAMEMRVFGAQATLSDRADGAFLDAARLKLGGDLRAARVSAIGWATFGIGFVGAIVLTLSEALAGRATPGDVMLVVSLVAGLRFTLSFSAGALSNAHAATRVLDRILWLRDYAASKRAAAGSGAELPARLQTGIRLCGVSFTYPGTSRPILDDVSIDLPAGAVVAIVGHNGAGKTTLAKLLAGLYTPSSGHITVDGLTLAGVRPEVWQSRVSATFQDFLKLEESLRVSVGVADERRLNDDAALLIAIERGDASTLMSGWVDGLDTQLGKTYADGEQLSGGQWQRVAVARAMLREEPLILILDEPTAALDPEAEFRLYERYAGAAASGRDAGSVTVLISHRFSSVRMADIIITMDEGRVAEQGTHQELMAAGGVYADLYRTQAAAYR